MPKQSSAQIAHIVDTFVSQLSALVHEQALDMVREALGEAKAPVKRRGPGRPRKTGRGPGRPRKAANAAAPKRTGNRGRRSADEVAAMETTVLAHVTSNPGQRLEEIGKALGEATKDLKRPVANMLEAGMLRTEGQKRGTKYFAGRSGGTKRKTAKKATKRRARKPTRRKATTAGRPKANRKKTATKRKTTRAKPAAKKGRRKLSPAQKAVLVERLAKARAAKQGAA